LQDHLSDYIRYGTILQNALKDTQESIQYSDKQLCRILVELRRPLGPKFLEAIPRLDAIRVLKTLSFPDQILVLEKIDKGVRDEFLLEFSEPEEERIKERLQNFQDWYHSGHLLQKKEWPYVNWEELYDFCCTMIEFREEEDNEEHEERSKSIVDSNGNKKGDKITGEDSTMAEQAEIAPTTRARVPRIRN
jgi:hypothetical protein